MAVEPDAVQRIAAAVTPAVMVSACGLVALGLDNQVSRMSARLRELAREHRDLPEQHARRALVRQQVAVRRAGRRSTGGTASSRARSSSTTARSSRSC